MSGLTRRDVLKTSAALAGMPLALRAQSQAEPNRITDLFFDLANIYKWDGSNGDTWDPFWADDDNLYAFNCDGRGRDLAFNRLTGDTVRTLTGSMVDPMDEYGKSSQKEKDNATWKACGQECIDAVFYAFVSPNVYGSDSGDYWLRQTAFNTSLIKSTDQGLTWTRTAAENYQRPICTGPAFGCAILHSLWEKGEASRRTVRTGMSTRFQLTDSGRWRQLHSGARRAYKIARSKDS